MELQVTTFAILALILLIAASSALVRGISARRGTYQAKEFITIRIVGGINILFAACILVALIIEPYLRFLIILLFPLLLGYLVVGYGLATLTLKSRVLPLIPAVAVFIFALLNIPSTFAYALDSSPVPLIINLAVVLLNGYVIHVVAFSKDKVYFSRHCART